MYICVGVIRRHNGVKPYVCSECPMRFCTSTALKSHQLAHLGIRNFGCILCNKSFLRKLSVVRHFRKCASKLGFSDMLML